jgi:hypothetical protein
MALMIGASELVKKNELTIQKKEEENNRAGV